MNPSVNTPHPALVFRTPVEKVHVRLEDFSDTGKPRLLWDADYSGAPGGKDPYLFCTEHFL
jgi:hypothetical protein